MLFKINIIDDEKNLNDLVRTYLEKEGYSVCSFYTYDEALLHKDDDVHLWLIDIMLDKASGFELFNEIKASKPKMPIIFMSARDQEFDRIIGLEKGSDDYITKPFSLKLVLMRIEAVLRRTKEKVENHNIFISHGIKLDTNRHTVEVNGKEINLTQLEFDILEVFMKHRNQVLTRDNLINQVWGYDFTGDEKAVNIHVMNLRRKLDIDCIQTIRGVGYKFESED